MLRMYRGQGLGLRVGMPVWVPPWRMPGSRVLLCFCTGGAVSFQCRGTVEWWVQTTEQALRALHLGATKWLKRWNANAMNYTATHTVKVCIAGGVTPGARSSSGRPP